MDEARNRSPFTAVGGIQASQRQVPGIAAEGLFGKPAERVRKDPRKIEARDGPVGTIRVENILDLPNALDLGTE
jgi:hypothetical protein